MYKRDLPLIRDHALASPEGLHDVVTFVLCTIQSGLSTCKLQLADIRVNGAASKYLWGAKAGGYQYTKDNALVLWAEANMLVERGLNDPENIAKAVYHFMQIPGLGMVKASFVCQMLGFNVSCIDSHNLKRLGLDANAVKVSAKLSEIKQLRKVEAYVVMCQIEGTEYWWDSWCEYVAGNRANKRLDSGDAVSAYHVDCVIGNY